MHTGRRGSPQATCVTKQVILAKNSQKYASRDHPRWFHLEAKEVGKVAAETWNREATWSTRQEHEKWPGS